MKTVQDRSLVLLAIVCLALAVPKLCAAETDRNADHAALRQLRDKVAAAINGQDISALTPCFAKQFAFTTVTQAVLTNQIQVQAFFDKMFRAKDALVASMKTEPTADILTRFIDENTGVCYGSTTDTYTMKSGEVVMMTNRWSATVVKEDGQWKVALAQVGTDFLDNPVLTKLSAFWRTAAVGAGIGGLLLGLVLGMVFFRRKKTVTA